MSTNYSISESKKIGFLLAISGGFMDTYSYICRGNVFANAQTGNIILFAVNASENNTRLAFNYAFPILAFIIGILIADAIKHLYPKKRLVWQQISLLVEIVILIIVAFLPQSLNLLSNSITSLVCAIQVESFRSIRGNGTATTMCIGNLRSASEHLFKYIISKNKASLKTSLLYYSIILSFIIGALLGKESIKILNEKAILISPVILFIAFILIHKNKDEA